MPRANAIDVATRKLHQSGNLDSSGNNTIIGSIRGGMSPEQRAIDREIKYNGGFVNNYIYNPKTNRAKKR